MGREGTGHEGTVWRCCEYKRVNERQHTVSVHTHHTHLQGSKLEESMDKTQHRDCVKLR